MAGDEYTPEQFDAALEYHIKVEQRNPDFLKKLEDIREEYEEGFTLLDALEEHNPKFEEGTEKRNFLEKRLKRIIIQQKIESARKGDVQGQVTMADQSPDGPLKSIYEGKTLPGTMADEEADDAIQDITKTIIPPKKRKKPQQCDITKTIPVGIENERTVLPTKPEAPEESGIDIFADAEEDGDKPDPLGTSFFADDKTSITDSSKKAKYELIKILGAGGMGEIWKAKDTNLDRIVAIKKMKGVHPDFIKRFLNEARITGQLEHPNIPPVHDLTEESLEFDMKLVYGEDLLKIIKQIKENKKEYKQKYSKREMLKIFSKACEALAFAHSKGVIHRDIKPENIMVGEFGEVQVMDWGLAKKIGTPDKVGKSAVPNPNKANTEGLTMAGSIMGTPIYMSPEQAGAELEEIDAQSDIYSLGATLFELLTLEKPIKVEKEDTPMNIVYKVLKGKIRKMRRTPKELESIVKKAMVLKKNKRYKTANELRDDIQRYLDGEKVKAHKYGFMDNVGRSLKKHSKAILTGAAAFVLITAGIAGITYSQAQTEKAEAGKAKAEAQAEVDKTKAAKAEAKAERAEKEKIEKTLEAKVEAEGRRDEALHIIQCAIGYYRQDKNPKKAIEELNRALEIDPDNPVALNNVADCYQLLGKLELAEKYIKKAIKLKDDDPLFHMVHGKILEKQKKYDQAEKTFIKSTKVKEHPLMKTIFELGAFYKRTAVKRYKKSISDRIAQYKKGVDALTRYVKVMKNDGEAYYVRGGCYINIGLDTEAEQNEKTSQEKHEEACVWYRKAEQEGKIAVEKECGKGYGISGRAKYGMGRFNGTFVNAEKDLKKAAYYQKEKELENIKWMLEQIEKQKQK